MSEITVQPKNPHRLYAGDTIYALYKVYPKGSRWFIGHFRSKFDYEAEVRWLDKHEPDPVPCRYVAEETGDWGIKDICDSAKFIAECEAKAKASFERKQQTEREYEEYQADLKRRGIKESDLPLSQRRWPRLFGPSHVTLADCYWWTYYGMDTNWAAENEIFTRRIKEVA